MNRLDRHVAMVRGKLTLEQFFSALGFCLMGFGVATIVAILVDRFFWLHLPKQLIWFWSGALLAGTAALVLALMRKPTAHQAAVFIDTKLELKEKFSTALYARQSAMGGDPFAMAAIADAERTADNVSLHRRFPMEFPRSGYFAMGAMLLALVVWFLPQFDLFHHHDQISQVKAPDPTAARAVEREKAKKVLAMVSSMPKTAAVQPKVELAKRELERVLNKPNADPTDVRLTAQKAQEEAEQAQQEELKNTQAYAQNITDKAMFNSLNVSSDDHGAVADASREIASGNFAKAADTLASLPDKFKDMKPEEKKKTQDDMQKLAEQMQKIASDPNAMKNLQQQMQQAGVTQQQAQQMAQTMQQAAAGNQQAQANLAKMQQQVMQQMNAGKGPSQQQTAAIQKAMQQMQSVAGGQATAQQVAAAAQQMAQAMAQANGQQNGAQQQQQQGKGGQQQGQGQMANAQSGQPNGQQSGQQAGQKGGGQQQAGSQQAGAQQGSGQQQGQNQQASAQNGGSQGQGQKGNQPGQQPGGNQQASAGGQQQGPGQGQQGQGGQQQMKDASQQMSDALNKMDAVQKDASDQVVDNPQDQGDQPGDGQNPGQGQQPKGGNQKGNGQGQCANNGGGGHGTAAEAQFAMKQEKDPSKMIANGKIIAKTFVKADRLVGKSTVTLSPAEKASMNDATDDVDENNVPKDTQQAVKQYFDTLSGGKP